MNDAGVALPAPTYVPIEGSNINPSGMMTNITPSYPPPSYNMSNITNPYAMQPVYDPNVNMYEQQMAYRQKLAQQRAEYFQKILKEQFPSCFVVFHIMFLVFYIIVAITIQTLEMISSYGLYYIGSGYWCAGYFLILVLFTTLLLCKKTYGLFTAVLILNIFGLFINFAGLIIISALGFPSGICYYNYQSFSFNVYKCATSPSVYQGIVMIVLGVLAIIELIVYQVVVGCTLTCKASNFKVDNSSAVPVTNSSAVPVTINQNMAPQRSFQVNPI